MILAGPLLALNGNCFMIGGKRVGGLQNEGVGLGVGLGDRKEQDKN